MQLYKIARFILRTTFFLVLFGLLIEIWRAQSLTSEPPLVLVVDEEEISKAWDEISLLGGGLVGDAESAGLEDHELTEYDYRNNTWLFTDRLKTNNQWYLMLYKGTPLIIKNIGFDITLERSLGTIVGIDLDWVRYYDKVPEGSDITNYISYNTNGRHWLGFLFGKGEQRISIDDLLEMDELIDKPEQIPTVGNRPNQTSSNVDQPFTIYRTSLSRKNLLDRFGIERWCSRSERRAAKILNGEYMLINLNNSTGYLIVQSHSDNLKIKGSNIQNEFYCTREGNDPTRRLILLEEMNDKIDCYFKYGWNNKVTIEEIVNDYLPNGRWVSSKTFEEL